MEGERAIYKLTETTLMIYSDTCEPANTGAPTATPSECLIALPDVIQRLRTSKSTVYATIRRGKFPKPIRHGRASRWLASDIDAYIARLAATRAP